MINIRYLTLVPLIALLLLPAFAVPLYKPIQLFFVCIIGFFLFFIFFKQKYLFKRINLLRKKTPLKYFLYFATWLLVDGLLLVLLGKYSILNYIYYILTLLLITFTFTYLLPALIFPKYFSRKFLIKFMFLTYFILCIVGLIQYVSATFDLTFINVIIAFLTNIRFLLNENHQLYDSRLSSLFEEPGYFGAFLFLNFPIVYNLCCSKYRIFDNKYLNILIKKSLVPLFWICLILTKSPIWLIFCLILTGIYFSKRIIAFIIKHAIKFGIATIIIVILAIIFFSKVNISDTYLNRIYLTITVLGNWNLFVVAEPSLATRLLSYFYTFKVFLANCILGVGLGNTKYYTLTQVFNDPQTMTYEMSERIRLSILSGGKKLSANGSFPFDILSDSGIIGFILFYYFLIKSYIYTNKIKYIYNTDKYLFLDGISKSILAFITISFYDINYATLFIWFFIGLPLVF